jgi:two-component system sensor histidine kinase HydH
VEDLRPRTTLFCAILALAIALGVLLRGRRAVHWLFAAFATDVAFWYLTQSLYGLFLAPIWVRATGVLTVLLPQFAVHLFQAIVPVEGQSPFRALLPRIAALLGIPMLALQLSAWGHAPLSLGLLYFYVFGLLSAGLVSLAQRAKRSTSRTVRDRVRFLVWVGALATAFTLADFLSFLGVVLPPIGAVFSIVFIYVLAESLTRHRLTDVYELAGRLLVSTALAFSLAGVFYIFIALAGRFNTMYLNAVLAAIVFLVLFEPLQSEVERRIHQFFFRERYDLETSVGELRKRLSHVLETDEMVDTLLTGLERSRRVTMCAIYLRDQDGNGYDLCGSIGDATPPDADGSPLLARIPKRVETLAARPLFDRLQKQGSVSLEELSRERTETDIPVLTAADALGPLKGAVVLAVRSDEAGKPDGSQDPLVGFIALADSRVRDAFTPEEIVLLETVAAQIGVAIANSRIYTQMKERDRLAALGAMAAGLAHEVKNPLGAIKGAAQLLEETGPLPQGGPAAIPSDGTPPSEWVGIILEEVNRLDRVVGSFLAYARPHAGNPVPLDVNAAVRRTVQILSSQLSGDVDLRIELSAELPRAKIDPEQLRQVLINLIQNAIQAMNGRGRVTVSTNLRRARSWSSSSANWSAGGAASERAPSSTDGELIEVAVRDTGPGISQKVLKNLFVPFFTTKDQGTGLGLAISQSIVQNAGGSIQVQSQPGAGTTFTIVLPIAPGSHLSTPLPEVVSPLPLPAAEKPASATSTPKPAPHAVVPVKSAGRA